MKIAVCDDEEEQLRFFTEKTEEWAIKRQKSVIVKSFISAQAFWFEWYEDKSFDLLLLDIRMPGMDGVELAGKIREADRLIMIVFVTSLTEYVYEGYNLDAMNYLLKPVDAEKLEECLDRACARAESREDEKESLTLPVKAGIIRIPVREIRYLEAEGRSCLLYTDREPVRVNKSIGELENMLKGYAFVRSHRSFLVPVKRIRKIIKGKVILDCREEIPVGRRMQTQVSQAFIKTFVRKEE